MVRQIIIIGGIVPLPKEKSAPIAIGALGEEQFTYQQHSTVVFGRP